MKCNHYSGRWMNRWFWRTHAQQEIDYLEEYDGQLYAYEFKYKKHRNVRFPKSFLKAYPESKTGIITSDVYEEFIMT